MATLRELKGRIGSVASSEKITGAMKMISSAKMHKAEIALRQLRPFRDQIEHIMANLLSADTVFTSPLMESRDVRDIAVIIFGSDDGLCGAYNVNLFKRLLVQLREYRSQISDEVRVTVIPVGGKMAKAVSAIASPRVSVVEPGNVDSKSEGDAVRLFEEDVRNRFIAGEFDRVDMLYMHYHSAGRQRPVCERLLPLDTDALVPEDARRGAAASARPYIFEPDARTIFTQLLPLSLLAIVQDVFTENRASEQAARVMAMQAANDNAKKLLDQLRLEYNKLRQQSITTELLDIIGGQVR